MPSWNPFKRRKSGRAISAEQVEPSSPQFDYGSVRSAHSRQLSSDGERPASQEILPPAQPTPMRMYDVPRRAPFGRNVKYKGPPQHGLSPTASPVPERHQSPSPLAHEEHEVAFADEPIFIPQPQLSPVESQKPTKARGGLFGIFRRKSKKVKAEETGFVAGSRELSPVSSKGVGPSGRKHLTKGVCRHQITFP